MKLLEIEYSKNKKELENGMSIRMDEMYNKSFEGPSKDENLNYNITS